MTTHPDTSEPDLHAQIMNLPCDASKALETTQPSLCTGTAQIAYKLGHRDARHAAAGLAAAHLAAERTAPSPAEPEVQPVASDGRYRKKPVVIDAWHIGHESPVPGWAESAFADEGGMPAEGRLGGIAWCPSGEGLYINTLEGGMRADMGDWLIRGVKGELYPCKPDIFAATYEPAGATPSAPAATVPLPAGWRWIAVKDFDALARALERADRKGYMPDAMAEEWAAFYFREAEDIANVVAQEATHG